MEIWMELTKSGIEFYSVVAFVFLPIMVLASYGRDKKIKLARICVDQMFLLYICCLMAIVFLPTKEMFSLDRLDGFQLQFVPFHWIVDLFVEPSVSVVSGVVLNILLTVPFGFYLRCICKWNTRKVVIATLLLSISIEIIQFSGFFGSFPMSYRVSDVDDLMTNTLGGFVGCVCVEKVAELVNKVEVALHIKTA